ncbi:MAG: hypothetical protein ACTSRS_17550 [Candidatus Helarchaeota archaeon]
MTKETKQVESVDIEAELSEQDVENLYARHKKWKAALQFNKNLQSRYTQEIAKWRTLRDQLKEEIQAIREEALAEKNKRDEINAEVARLKEDRAAANTQIALLKEKRNESWDKVKAIRERLRAIINQQKEAKQQLKPIFPLMKRLEEIEWTIITKSIPFEQEEALMDEYERIIAEISKRRKEVSLDIATINFEEAKRQIDEFRAAAQKYHELMIQTVQGGEEIHTRILSLVKKSEPHHQKMIELFSQIDQLKAEEEAAHQKMIENVKELEMLRKGRDEIFKELRAIEKKLAYIRAKKAMVKAQLQEAKEKELLDKKTEIAFAKYKAGKKLDMHEFTLLMKKGLLKKEES